MRTRRFRILLTAAVLFAVCSSSMLAMAETRLYVPRFQFSDSEDTQFLIANENDREAPVDFWAFTAGGELLGQFQVSVPAHGTRSLTLGEAFLLTGQTVSGWIGAVSREDGIQLSYNRIGEGVESFEAQAWISREMQLTIADSSKDVARFSNPNPFGANLTIYGMGANGQFVGVQELSVGPFSQTEVPAANLFRGQAARLRITSNADVMASLDSPRGSRTVRRERLASRGEADRLALVIDSQESIGAYQVTLSFDPQLVQFSTKDIEGGAAEGFDSRPLVVNIDNVAGRLTIGSFQVGARPNGRTVVARLNASGAARFGIQIDEVTDTLGNSLSGLSAGVVRMR